MQPKQPSRRPVKRTRQSPEIPQTNRTTQNTARPAPTSPSKAHKAAAPSRETNAAVLSPQPAGVRQPALSGNFDLYGMYLPFLARLYLPHDATTPDYAAVYDRILASQAKHDYTARCFLAPQDLSSSAPPHGRFESVSVLDPIAERPFDVTLNAFTYKKSLTFTPTECSSFPSPEYSVPGPGLVGHTGLPSTCGIKSARGVFKIKRVWVNEQDGATKELFEGFFSFSVSYDSIYKKAGRGNGAKWKFAFWGVRAMKDNTGQEIGLGPRKLW